MSLLIFILVILVCGSAGGFITSLAIPKWYRFLSKPNLSPPNWIFAPVWTTLYLMMAVSVWRIWRIRRDKPVSNALSLFVVQFCLNILWTPVFFGLRNPGLGLGVILVLWAMIGFTVREFYKFDKIAAYLLLPYLAWVSFATYLNAGIYILNR